MDSPNSFFSFPLPLLICNSNVQTLQAVCYINTEKPLHVWIKGFIVK